MNRSSNNVSEIHHCEDLLPVPPLDTESWAVVIMLCVFGVVGLIGNGLVIYVYTKKKDKLTSSVFILALAGTDFFTCVVIMPYTAVSIWRNYIFVLNLACNLYIFFITFNVPLSAFLMVAISIDRYLCICHPFCHLLTKKRAKILIFILCIFASILGVLSSIAYSVEQTPKDLEQLLNINSSVWPKDCELIYTGQCNPSSVHVPMQYSDWWQKVYSSFYLISLIIVFTLYVLIYHSVTKRRSKRRREKAGKKLRISNDQTEVSHCNTQTIAMTNGKDTHDEKLVEVKMNQNGVSSKAVMANSEECTPLQKRKHTTKERKDHDRLANIKTAVMLFTVAVVFILAFLPAWLMALQIIDHQQIVFYMYFIYNVVNPIIYAFMNPTFRQDIRKILLK